MPQSQPIEDVTMFGVDQTPDGGAVLTLTSHDEHGQLWSGVFRMDPRITCAFRQAVLTRVNTAATPAAQEAAAAQSRALLASYLIP